MTQQEISIVQYKAGILTGAAALLVVLTGCTKKPGGRSWPWSTAWK
ncbi:MAG: hypothetical protein M3N34_07070 [Pseudomonadota bacterium]|nr:hypothetical protein [Pseudomonadota bacterium]